MIFNREKAKVISIYGTIHAVVDFCCAAILYSFVGKVDIVQLLNLVILYNVLAFGLQSFMGLLIDRYKFPRVFSICGCAFIIVGILFLKMPIVAISMLGVGNALFHIGGGYVSLSMGNGRAKLPGLFVAPGALGLFFGSLLWKIPHFNIYWLLILPIISIILLVFAKEPELCKNQFPKARIEISIFLIISMLILLSVCIRSFVGMGYDFVAKDNFNLLLVFVCAVAAGKFFGGIFADKFGMFNTAVIALLISIPLLHYGYIIPLAILGIFVFNFTMPITLTALANIMPKNKGLAFGLTTAALIIGAFPILYGFKVLQGLLFDEIILLSVVITAISLKMYEKLFDQS